MDPQPNPLSAQELKQENKPTQEAAKKFKRRYGFIESERLNIQEAVRSRFILDKLTLLEIDEKQDRVKLSMQFYGELAKAEVLPWLDMIDSAPESEPFECDFEITEEPRHKVIISAKRLGCEFYLLPFLRHISTISVEREKRLAKLIRSKELHILTGAIHQVNARDPSMRVLDLNNANIRGSNYTQFKALSRALKKNPYIKTLILSKNDLRGLSRLANLAAVLTHITVLDLSETRLDEESIRVVASSDVEILYLHEMIFGPDGIRNFALYTRQLEVYHFFHPWTEMDFYESLEAQQTAIKNLQEKLEYNKALKARVKLCIVGYCRENLISSLSSMLFSFFYTGIHSIPAESIKPLPQPTLLEKKEEKPHESTPCLSCSIL